MFYIFTVLMLAVIMVNGWTDAPNAIATCVCTRSLSPKGAVCLASVCNFLGCVGMALISSRVAETVFNIVDLSDHPSKLLPSLSAGMCAVVLWSALASKLGIPTSESHGLMAGISGAAFASTMSLSVINLREWSVVILGLLASTLPSFLAAKLLYSGMRSILLHFPRRIVIKHFTRAQICSAASSALLHGAQDSQKFMGVFMLGLSLTEGNAGNGIFNIPISLVTVCAAAMTVGTLLGGMKIIKKVGLDMVTLDADGGTAADMSSSAVLTVCSLLGIPVSTTHAKACAMMGVGSCTNKGANQQIIREILAAWLLTFPICASLGFLISFFIFQ